MAINSEHVPLYLEVFEFLKSRLRTFYGLPTPQSLIIGHQEILEDARDKYPFMTVSGLFKSWGWNVLEIDYHDNRADFLMDLNVEHPYQSYESSWDLVFDIGTLEHIADSQMALENYLAALRAGGYLFLLTPCKGYFDHGLHTFSPEYILETLRQNGCETERIWYVKPEWEGGEHITAENYHAHMIGNNLLIVVIARLTKEFQRPIKPIQQKRWMKEKLNALRNSSIT